MKKPQKIRADELVVKLGLAESRTKAQALIMAGQVKLPSDEVVKKAGQSLSEDTLLTVANPNHDVGRGAQKLRGALDHWSQISLSWGSDVHGLDIGASTGGFTQVLLDKGATKVVALDVGTHQLHERLRSDPRVISLEQQHVLKMTPEIWQRIAVTPPFDVIVTDVSFISITRILEVIPDWLKPGASWIFLLKPQFELGPQKAPGGIVKKAEHHDEAIRLVKDALSSISSLKWIDIIPSPIFGGDGNKEFLVWIQKKS